MGCYHDNPAVHNIDCILRAQQPTVKCTISVKLSQYPAVFPVKSRIYRLEVESLFRADYCHLYEHIMYRLSALTASGGRFTLATSGRMCSQASALTRSTMPPRSVSSTTPRTGRRMPSSAQPNGEKLLALSLEVNLLLFVCLEVSDGKLHFISSWLSVRNTDLRLGRQKYHL